LLGDRQQIADEEPSVKSVTQWIEAHGKRRGAVEVLAQLEDMPLERRDAGVSCLLRTHGFAAVRSAFIELLEWAPREDFPALRDVFRERFAH
jgi:hypothetical protein